MTGASLPCSRVASVSRTPGNTKRIQRIELAPGVVLRDTPPLPLTASTERAPPVAATALSGVAHAHGEAAASHLYELLGLVQVANVREAYSAVRVLYSQQDLARVYNVRPAELKEATEESGGALSPHAFCNALAAKKGYFMRGKKSLGAPDPHRAGLQVLYDTTDGAVTFVSHAAALASAEAARAGPDNATTPPSSTTCLLWLAATLRVADNALLLRAMVLGAKGLEVVVVWRHGPKVPTPAASFMAHALRALHASLRELGSGLVVLHACDESDESAAAAVAARALELGVEAVVVDACEASGATSAVLLEAALRRDKCAAHEQPAPADNGSAPTSASMGLTGMPMVEAMVDDTLIAHEVALSCLPPATDETGLVLRWTDFLKAAAQLDAVPPSPAPTRLPPPLSLPTDTLHTLPADSKWWGVPTFDGWLHLSGSDISEAGALRLAESAGHGATRDGRSGYGRGHLGERAGAGGVVGYESGYAVPRPSYVSPFLRWGMLSPRQAEAAGVRRRDLLWRDFSRLCWRVVAPLRLGQPVTQVLALDDGSPAPLPTAKWSWTLELHPPEEDPPVTSVTDPPASSQHTPKHDTVATLQKVGRCMELPSWSSLLGLSEAAAFEAWCVGRTGAPLVDAGMIQLWATGWMPRRLRLLCAACLVEGLGIDWRLGRDWFAYALIDHDYAINECMWQNAGLCGVDPFYRGLQWDALPCDSNDEYVEGSGGAARNVGSTPSTQEMLDGDEEVEEEDGGKEEEEDDDDEMSTNCYTRRWLHLPPLAIPPWPPALHAATSRPRPPLGRVRAIAASRRAMLVKAYQTGGRVSRVGVIVDPPALATRLSGSFGCAASWLPDTPAAATMLPPGSPNLCARAADSAPLSLLDGVGSAANEIVRVGHLCFRMPPITHGRTWVSAKRAAVAATADAASKAWEELADYAHTHTGEPPSAHEKAARRLIQNHARVLHDVANPARWTNIDGRALTQLELVRVPPDAAAFVDEALRETARRLLGQPPTEPLVFDDAFRDARAAAWMATAVYLTGRIQGVPEQKVGRVPDVDADAADAMRAVLLEVRVA